MAKDAKGHGSDARGGPAKPIPDHPFHGKSDAELNFIAKDAHAAAQAMQGHNSTAENKYRDQVNDASTVLGYRSRGGAMDIAEQHGIPTSHLSGGGMPATTLDHGTLKLLVSNPQAANDVRARGLSVPSSAEAEGVLRSRYGYGDDEIKQLKSGK